MPSIHRAFYYLLHNRMQFLDSTVKNLGFLFPDKLYLSLRYRLQMGKWIDWGNPKTFNEKINWLKIHDRKPEYTTMVDKCAVKDYVEKKIGEEYIIPTIGVWDRAEDIEWDKLPERFVLKATNGGGGCEVVICTDKSKLDIADAIQKLNTKSCFYKGFREWPYKNIKGRIIAEKFMAPKVSSAPKDLWDYKFYCFNGEPLYCQVIRDRHSKETIDFYDMEWVHQDFVGLNPKCNNGTTPVAKPIHLDDMIRVCRELSKGIPFVRVDLYVIDDKEYFGELTFYPAGGIGCFSPAEWESRLGDLITLPTETGGGYKCLIINDVVELREISGRFGDIKDYKFFCFDGKVKCFKVDFDRFNGHKANYYSPSGELLPFGEAHVLPDYSHEEPLPYNLNQMIGIAEKLSEGHPFLRVDLYNVNGKIYFGELTFYPAGGFGPFTDDEWDEKLGKLIKLPQ